MFGNMVYPMLTIILQQKFSLYPSQIALLLAIDSVSLFIASFIGGKLADAFNQKWVIIICDFLTVTAYLVCFFLPLSYVTIALIIIGGAYQQMELASYNTLIAEMTTKENRDKGYSLFYLCFNIGAFVSTAVSGFMINEHISLIFLLDAVGVGISTIIIMIFVKYKKETVSISKTDNTVKQTEQKTDTSKGFGFEIFRKMPILGLFLVTICFNEIVHNEYSYLIPMELDRFLGDDGSKVYGTLISFTCVIVILFTTAITNFLHKKRALYKLQLSNIFQISGYIVFGFGLIVKNIPLFYLGFLIYILGEICDAISYEPYLMQITPKVYRGRIDGFFSMTMKIAVMLANLLIGFLYEISPLFAWVIFIVIGIIPIVLTVHLKKMDKIRKKKIRRKKKLKEKKVNYPPPKGSGLPSNSSPD